MEITNWPTDAAGEPVVEHVDIVNNPENADDGVRSVPFSGRLFIEQEDFMAEPAAEVLPAVARQARCGCAAPIFVTATDFDVDADGNVTKVLRHLRPGRRGAATRPTGAR